MARLLVYLLLLGFVMYFLWYWGKRGGTPPSSGTSTPKPARWFKSRRASGEPWVQVYETASFEEAKKIQVRLEEEDLECILYEQGKKDIYGKALPGTGIAVPKAVTARAQNIISRMAV
ncbi:MAG: hypothetical protein ACOY3K_03080 [Candidatus Omnitrophota bacterium]